MASAKTQRWKGAEYEFADTLKEFKIPAERIKKGTYESDHDVRIIGHPNFKGESKFSAAGFKTSRLAEVTEMKYCTSAEDVALMFFRAYKGVVNRGDKNRCGVDARFMSCLLSYWLGFGSKDELWDIYVKGNKVPKKETKDAE